MGKTGIILSNPLYHILLWPGLLAFINILVIFPVIPFQSILLVPAFFLIPGYLVLEGIRYENRNFSFILYYSVGISILLVFLAGLAKALISGIDPGYHQFSPLSTLFWYDFLFLSCLSFYFFMNRDTVHHIPFSRFIRKLQSSLVSLNPRVAFLGILLILCSITGAYANQRWENNTPAIITILIVCVLVWYANSSKCGNGDFSYMLWCISVALLLQSTLISPFLRGADIQRELEHMLAMQNSGSWLAVSQGYLNSMLSISVLGPEASTFLTIPPTDVLRIIYPLIFSLLPVALYQVYSSFLERRESFDATFLFIAFAVFFSEMLSLGRQEIAEFFLGMLLLVSIDHALKHTHRRLLFVFSLLAVVWSHYALAYSLIILFIIAFVFKTIWQVIRRRRHKQEDRVFAFDSQGLVRISTIIILGVFTFCWYIYTSQSISFYAIFERIKPAISFYVSQSGNGDVPSSYITYATGQAQLPSAGMVAATVIFDLIQVLILCGIVYSLFSERYLKKTSFMDISSLAVASLVFLGFAVFVPLFGNSLNISRIYHILLIFLAPFGVVGLQGIFAGIPALLKRRNIRDQERDEKKWYYQVICLVFLAFFVFQSGLAFTLTRDIPISYSLNYRDFQYQFVFREDIQAAEWLGDHSPVHSSVLGDLDFSFIYNFRDSFYPNITRLIPGPPGNERLAEDQYYLVRKGNERSGVFRTTSFSITGKRNESPDDRLYRIPRDQIYSSGAGIFTR